MSDDVKAELKALFKDGLCGVCDNREAPCADATDGKVECPSFLLEAYLRPEPPEPDPLPCPSVICGSEHVQMVESTGGPPHEYRVKCITCGAKTRTWHYSKTEAALAWNQRPEPERVEVKGPYTCKRWQAGTDLWVLMNAAGDTLAILNDDGAHTVRDLLNTLRANQATDAAIDGPCTFEMKDEIYRVRDAHSNWVCTVGTVYQAQKVCDHLNLYCATRDVLKRLLDNPVALAEHLREMEGGGAC